MGKNKDTYCKCGAYIGHMPTANGRLASWSPTTHICKQTMKELKKLLKTDNIKNNDLQARVRNDLGPLTDKKE